MSKRVSDKNKAEPESQHNLEDLPVDDASQEEVKGGVAREYQLYTMTLTHAGE